MQGISSSSLQITPVEVMSGVMRRQRNGEIPAKAAHSARLVLDRHCQRDYIVTAIDIALIQRAEDLLERYPLRAYDAIQLASALESDDALPADPLTFVSADQRLLTAASAEGLAIEDPNLHN
jgi:predicted nucleic acid-binding protein